MNLRHLLQHFNEMLADLYEEEEVTAIFYVCIEHVSGLNRMDVRMNWERILLDQEEQRYSEIATAMTKGRPVQHVLGETTFYGFSIQVSPDVLIPRPETEELVDWILTTLRSDFQQAPETGPLRVIDFGTGSGCIPIAIKKHIAEAVVEAVDISQTALKVAKHNALMNNAEIRFIQADMCNYKTEQKYDLMVSNPPYIKNLERIEMHKNVLEHEPHLALFVPDERPLLFYEALADLAAKSLNEQGYLFFEINEHLAQETIDMLASKSFKTIELRKDMQGKDRMLMTRLC
ncbi:putative protoporphyrinogen oxidase [Pedobacter sp. BAL39]|uniref:peptide chain release factor N(5)-glutamine methyltransferase n=1 Tax=Pedobacter sp. BAL39 TaxID=391596 RepID=UPI0001559EB5|nr:peptide chain release factor N(5)-glutamine methyltransferase [Pedobacter sp. BAL39]EDM38395.1 putative protoporphyrinogen oxidase [Pedobacter sp. BAL39]